MKKLLLLSTAILLICGFSFGQTTLISPTGNGGFETGSTFAVNNWTPVNGAYNMFYVGSTPVVYAGTNCAFSGSSSLTWAGSANTSVNHFYRDVTFPAGETSITLKFYYKIAAPDAGYDYLKVFLVPSATVPVEGTQLATGQIGVTSGYESATTWTLVTIVVPASAAGTTQRLVFSWRSDGVSPHGAVAVDNIELTSKTPIAGNAPPTNFTPSLVTQTGMTITWTDNSSNETAFRVYRSTDNITFTQQGSDIASTTTVSVGTAYSQAQASLIPGTTYYYRIASVVDIESAYLEGFQSTNAGGVITSTGAGTGNWNDVATWSTGAIPTATDNVTILNGHTVNINVAVATCLNLTVGEGVSGVLTFTNATASTLTVNGSITVATGGNFNAGSTLTIVHNIYLGGNSPTSPYAGNLTVNGTFDMWLTATTGRASLTFYGVQNSIISGGGTLDFNSTNTLNKGTTTATPIVTPPILEIQKSFTVLGATASGFLSTLTAGTLKIGGTFIQTNPIFTATGYTVPATAGIWLNNANFTVAGLGGSPTVTGLFRVTSGTYNIGTGTGNSMGSGTNGVFIIEGGAINVTGRFNLTSTGVYYNQSGGTLSVATIGNASSAVASFGITSSTGTSFITSGGTIILVQRATGATIRDYYVVATPTFTGGTLQVGSAATATNFNFRLYGYAPNVVIDNTTNNKKVEVYQVSGVLYIFGTLTLNAGTTFDCLGMSAFALGNVVNNGIIQGLVASSRFDFSGTLPQTYSGSGTFGTLAAPFIGTGVGIANLANVTLSSTNQIFTTRVNLFSGSFINSGKFTLGIGGTSSVFIQRGGATTGAAGSFDVSPTFSVGSGGLGISYYSTTAMPMVTTGFEIPTPRTIASFAVNTANGVTLSGGGLSTALLTMTVGNLATSAANLITVTGTATTAIAYTAGYINGPVARTLPASLLTGSTYLFPVGKSAYKPLELVNPTTGAGGTVVVQAEVYDANCGGTPGLNMSALNTDRYWNATVTSSPSYFTNTTVRLTEAGMTANNGMAKSATLTGAYDLVSSAAPGTTIISDAITSLGFLAIGTKSVPMAYTSSTTTQASTATVLQSSTNQAIIGIQVVTTGNASPISLTNFTVNANGTTAAGDISNAKIWYTGTTPTFAATTQFGSTVASPALTNFDISGTQVLTSGTNYFWLTFDIPLNATATHVVDAECTSLTVAATAYAPAITAPAGTRTIAIDPPTALTPTVISSSEIDLAWTKNSVGQNVVVAVNSSSTFGSPVNGTPLIETNPITGGGTVIYNGPLAAYNHTSLSPQTSYYYKAWTVDANSYYSTTGATANATTPCANIKDFPYTESFSAALGCWSYAEGVAGATYHWGTVTADATHGAAGPQYGTYFASLNVYNASATYNPYYLTSPSFTLDAAPKQVKYYYWLGATGYTLSPVPLTLQISTNGGASWTPLYQHTSANSVFTPTSSVAGWTLNTIELSAYANQTVKFRFMSNSNYGSGFTNQGIDEFGITDILPPVITELSASSGCSGSSLTIYGTDLSYATSVTIGETPAVITANTPTSVTVTVGSGTTGLVVVTTIAGTVSTEESFSVYPLPLSYAVSGGGAYCYGSSGVSVTLGGSQTGVTYTLSTTPPTTMPGTGSALTFGPAAFASGVYTVTASNDENGCSLAMAGTVGITVNPKPSDLSIVPAGPLSLSPGTIQLLSANGGTISGITLLSENFNGVATGWSTVNNSTGGTPALAAWTIQNDGYLYNSETFHSNDNSKFYFSNSDAQGSGGSTNTILKAPPVNTMGYSLLNLSFYDYFKNYSTAANDSVVVEVSINNTSWVRVLKYSGSVHGGAAAFFPESVDLSAYVNQASLYVRFHYTSTYGYYWALDNVSITGDQTTNITWSPIDDLYTNAGATLAYTGTGNRPSLWTKPLESRTYTATSTSGPGCTSSQSILVTSCPAIPGSPATSHVTPTTFDFGWTYTNGNHPVTYTVDVATDNLFASPVAGSPFTVLYPALSLTVPGLTGSTVYYYRVMANVVGCSSDYTTPGSVMTLCPATVAPFTEDFEAPAFAPACWTNSAVSGSFVWARSNAASANGVGTASATANFFNQAAGTYELTTMPFDMGGLTTPTLRFDYAYATYVVEIDEMDVYYSTDFGSTWTALLNMPGGESGILNTAGTTEDAFIPTASQWASQSLTLPAGTNMLKFTAITAYGNNLYLDNIEVANAVPVNTTVGTVTVASGETNCYNATNTILVGTPNTFVVENGGSATFIAGQKIRFMPGTTVQEGGYLHGYISTGSYCDGKAPTLPAVAAEGTTDAPFSIELANFSIYPNPTNSNFTLVQKGNRAFGSVKIEVYNIRGAKVMTERMAGEKMHEFGFTEMPTGLYFIKVIADDYVETIKLVKTR
ncbi:MAG: T9SS type A sorting domain-containing protein [Bacteroidetes bacterium]|nr:T9SS type A sorting domain-containing protein [Bacteroidota bacterium]